MHSAEAVRRAARAGATVGLAGLLVGCGLVVSLLELSWEAEARYPSVGAVLFAGLAAFWLGRRAGPWILRRRSLLHALWVAPVSAILTLLSGTLGVAAGNLPLMLRLTANGEPAAEVWGDYALKPVLLGTSFGAIPALVVGLLCGLALWGWLESIETKGAPEGVRSAP